MPNRYEFSEKEKEQLRAERKINKNKNVEKRLYALLLHSEGMKRKDIASKTGFTKGYISELVRKYRDKELKSITQNNYRGNHRNLTFEEEQNLLEPFIERAEAGYLVDINEIKLTYEQAVGKPLNSNGQIYYVLQRHGFRKIMPRSKHPDKASDEVIETSKKLTI